MNSERVCAILITTDRKTYPRLRVTVGAWERTLWTSGDTFDRALANAVFFALRGLDTPSSRVLFDLQVAS